MFSKNRQYTKFCLYGFLKNLRFFDVFILVFFIENGLTFSQIGVLYASREMIANLSEIPSGLIADIYGRKRSLLAAFLLYIFSFIVFYFSISFSLLWLAMILFGVGDAFRSGTHKGMIIDYLKLNHWSHHKIDYYGHTRSWSQKGSAISALLGGLIVLYSGSYRIIYLISIIPYVINFINIYSYPKELNYSLNKKSSGVISIKAVLKSIITTLKQKKVFGIVNSSALHSAFLKSIKDYIQPLMVNIAVLLPILAIADTKSKSGLVIGIVYFFIFIMTSYASKIAGTIASRNIRHIENKTLLLGLFCGIICGISFHYDFWFLSLAFFIVIYIIENLRKPILTGFLADQVPNEILTSVLSSQSFYRTVATAILSLSIGVLADYYGIGFALAIVSVGLVILTLWVDRQLRLKPQIGL